MAWDVLVVRLPQGTRQLGALPEEYWPPAIDDVLARLRTLPDIELVGDTMAVVRSPEWVIEIDFSSASRVLLAVEGADASVEIVRAIADRLGAIAIDTTTGRAVDWSHDPSSGLRESRRKQELLEDVAGVGSRAANDTSRRRRPKLK